MTHGVTEARGSDEEPSDELYDFRSCLHELKTTGCNLLVVGDAPRDIFTQASRHLLGDPSEHRYRLLAFTDANPNSVADRLPTNSPTPRPLSETAKLINHALPPRPLTKATVTDIGNIPEEQVTDPHLAGLQSALVNAMTEFNQRAGQFNPAELRVGIDSFTGLINHYDDAVVRRFLSTITAQVTEYNAMAHYILTDPVDSESVQRFQDDFDAIIEVRAADAATHAAEQRWHVLDRDLTTDWLTL